MQSQLYYQLDSDAFGMSIALPERRLDNKIDSARAVSRLHKLGQGELEVVAMANDDRDILEQAISLATVTSC